MVVVVVVGGGARGTILIFHVGSVLGVADEGENDRSLLVVQPDDVGLRVTFGLATEVDGAAEGDLDVGRFFRQDRLLCNSSNNNNNNRPVRMVHRKAIDAQREREREKRRATDCS